MARTRAELHQRALKRRDFWWTVLVIDPVAMLLLPGVLRLRWLTPTRITYVALLLGAASIGAFAAGALIAGALLFQLRFLTDCIDGKVARVTGQTSAWGQFVDLAGDTATIGAAYAALGVWAMRQEIEGGWTVLVLLPLFGTAVWLHQYERGLTSGSSETTAAPSKPGSSEIDGGSASRPVRLWSLDRLYRHPGSVEIETLMLLVLPVFLPLQWFPYVVGIAAVFYAASSTEILIALWRKLGARDQALTDRSSRGNPRSHP